MFKYVIFALLLTLSSSARAEVVNYVTPSQQNLGAILGDNIKTIVVEDDFMADLDLTAAEHGDPHAMGTLANSCLTKKDYACAYKWAGVALKSGYWKQAGQEAVIEKIKNTAKAQLSDDKIAELDAVIKEFRPK